MDALLAEFRGTRFLTGHSGGEAGWLLLGGMERGLMMFVEQPEVLGRRLGEPEPRVERDPVRVDPGALGTVGTEGRPSPVVVASAMAVARATW